MLSIAHTIRCRSSLTDFFIASNTEIKAIDCRPAENTAEPDLADSDLDLLMLCNLESILTGNAWECVFDEVYINPVRDNGPEGPLVYQVSSALLSALQELDRDAIADCAMQWAETDEWTLREGTPIETIAAVLQGLIRLARQASIEGKSLFICTEL